MPVCPIFGTENATTAATPNGTAPNRIHGLDFPHFVFVLSIRNPTIRSEIPSITFVTRNITLTAPAFRCITFV